MTIERNYTEYAQYGLAQVRVHGEVFDEPIKKGETVLHSRVQITLIDEKGRDVPIDVLYAPSLTDSELKSLVNQTATNVKDFFPPSAS